MEPNEDHSWTEAELHEALDKYEQELRDNGLRRNTVNTYVQHPERFIRWLTGGYSPTGPRSENRDPLAKARSKYDPLHNYLVNVPERSVRMTFSQIERILGFELPSSARRYNAWWANQRDGNHSHARSWLDAHYETQWLDLNAQAITFTSPRSNLNTKKAIFTRQSGENDDLSTGPQESPPISNQSGGTDLAILGLLARTEHCLQRNGIKTVEVARTLSDDRLRDMTNFGPKLADDLRNRLKEFDLPSTDGTD